MLIIASPAGDQANAGDMALPLKKAASTATITPHRAMYEMTLGSVKNGGNITGVSGRMAFEWADACDGWAVQQHLDLHFIYSQGDETDVSSSEVTWESKDGKRYNFNIRRTSGGKETEQFRGKAVMTDKGGKVTYSVPEGKTAALPAGTIFPSTHTLSMLTKGEAGDHLFTRHVFDGADEIGSDDVSAFIHAQNAEWQTVEATPGPTNNPLLAHPYWPIRMAFFKPSSETGEPDYEMNIDLLPNGVVKTMRIDYGDFSVTGNLISVTPLPDSGC